MNFPDEFPHLWAKSGLMFYALRATGGLFAWIGVTFLVAAQDPKGYKSLIRANAYMFIVLGVICAVAGARYGLPRILFLADAVLSVVGGLVLFWSRPRVPHLPDIDDNSGDDRQR